MRRLAKSAERNFIRRRWFPRLAAATHFGDRVSGALGPGSPADAAGMSEPFELVEGDKTASSNSVCLDDHGKDSLCRVRDRTIAHTLPN